MARMKYPRTPTLLAFKTKEGFVQVREEDVIRAALWTARLMRGPGADDPEIGATLARLGDALREAK